MTLQQINSRLQEILTGMGVSIASLSDQANFARDLGLDSLDVTDLLVRVEHQFSIRIPDDDWWKLQTIGQLKDYLLGETAFDL
ncbi:acyl carrier protein [Fibrisoma montanum]|uniref:Acyl carrier protein n=1 Tax=Fibrisoma montanum TaxID=2305895 RepID=A0A418MK19_9BACT|nr:acyl carrier protein [Fibrisoma montanum]RIV27787.1 acyl carrier protein [Fibrisoma montanum]